MADDSEQEGLPPSITLPIVVGERSTLKHYIVPQPEASKRDTSKLSQWLLFVTLGTAFLGVVAAGAILGVRETTGTSFVSVTNTSAPIVSPPTRRPTFSPNPEPDGDGRTPSARPKPNPTRKPTRLPGPDGPSPTQRPVSTPPPTRQPVKLPGGDGKPQTRSPVGGGGGQPSPGRTAAPNRSPGGDGKQPTLSPNVDGGGETYAPLTLPSIHPTDVPTTFPTTSPTLFPTATPTIYPSSHPTFRPTSFPTCTPTGEELLLDFASAEVVVSNLGGYCVDENKCPQGSEQILLIEKVATTKAGIDIHLAVANASVYTPWKPRITGIIGDFLNVNLFGNSSVILDLSFFTYDANGDQVPFTFPEAEITIYDIDHGGSHPCEVIDTTTCYCEHPRRHREAVTIDKSTDPEIFLTENSTLCQIESGDKLQFFSTAYGGGAARPNPFDVDFLTSHDLSVSLGLRYKRLSSFRITLHAINGAHGTNFLLTGKTNIFPCKQGI